MPEIADPEMDAPEATVETEAERHVFQLGHLGKVTGNAGNVAADAGVEATAIEGNHQRGDIVAALDSETMKKQLAELEVKARRGEPVVLVFDVTGCEMTPEAQERVAALLKKAQEIDALTVSFTGMDSATKQEIVRQTTKRDENVVLTDQETPRRLSDVLGDDVEGQIAENN